MAKKISMTTLNNYMKSVKEDDFITIPYNIDDAVFEVKVKKNLTIPERSVFVDEIAKGCFVDNVFIPEYQSVMETIMFYRMFTELPVPVNPDVSGMVDIQQTFNIAAALKLVETACKRDEKICDLYDNLCYCAERQIEYIKQQKICAERSELINMLTQVQTISEWTKDFVNKVDIDKLNEDIDIINKFDPNIVSKGKT